MNVFPLKILCTNIYVLRNPFVNHCKLAEVRAAYSPIEHSIREPAHPRVVVEGELLSPSRLPTSGQITRGGTCPLEITFLEYISSLPGGKYLSYGVQISRGLIRSNTILAPQVSPPDSTVEIYVKVFIPNNVMVLIVEAWG